MGNTLYTHDILSVDDPSWGSRSQSTTFGHSTYGVYSTIRKTKSGFQPCLLVDSYMYVQDTNIYTPLTYISSSTINKMYTWNVYLGGMWHSCLIFFNRNPKVIEEFVNTIFSADIISAFSVHVPYLWFPYRCADLWLLSFIKAAARQRCVIITACQTIFAIIMIIFFQHMMLPLIFVRVAFVAMDLFMGCTGMF